MLDAHALILFLPAMLAITFLPGPDMLFVLAQSAAGGAKRGLVAVAGIISGGFVHIGAAAIGLSALLVRSASLFSLVKYAGAAYLVYLGLRTLLERESVSERTEGHADAPTSSPFVAGFVTNVLNPKVALFVLAFLPQFVEPARGHVGLQIAELGFIWYATGALVLSALALAGGAFDVWRRRSPTAKALQRYLTGTIFVALGVRVALP
jgi:threonine/homoserine/homoserine lactone efflux protein